VIRQINSNAWEIESHSKPGIVYLVVRGEAEPQWACDCPGFTFRQECSHIREVKEKEGVA